MNRRDALRSLISLPAVGSVSVAQVPASTIHVVAPVLVGSVDTDAILRALPAAIAINDNGIREAIEAVVNDYTSARREARHGWQAKP